MCMCRLLCRWLSSTNARMDAAISATPPLIKGRLTREQASSATAAVSMQAACAQICAQMHVSACKLLPSPWSRAGTDMQPAHGSQSVRCSALRLAVWWCGRRLRAPPPACTWWTRWRTRARPRCGCECARECVWHMHAGEGAVVGVEPPPSLACVWVREYQCLKAIGDACYHAMPHQGSTATQDPVQRFPGWLEFVGRQLN